MRAELRLVARLVSHPLAICGCGPPAYSDPAGVPATNDPPAAPDVKMPAAPAAAASPAGADVEAPGPIDGSDPAPAPRGRFCGRRGGGARGTLARAPPLRGAARALALQLLFTGQLPALLGLLSPVVLVASLGVWNFWVALDLVVGAALMALLLALCAALRCCGRGGLRVG